MGSEQSTVYSESPSLKLMKDPDYLPQYRQGEAPWVTDIDGVAVVRKAAKGTAAVEPQTIIDVFRQAAEKHPHVTALRVERTEEGMPPADGKAQDVAWKEWTYKEYYDEARDVAKSYITAGLEWRDGVVLWGFNAPEWHIAQMAAVLAGGVACGVYPTDNVEQVRYKSFDSNGAVAVVHGQKHVEVLAGLCREGALPKMKTIVYWTPCDKPQADFKNEEGTLVSVMSWNQFRHHGSLIQDEQLQEKIDKQTPGSCAALIYTSGTTGNPKGVMLSHDNFSYEIAAVIQNVFAGGRKARSLHDLKGGPLRSISYLPLSHVAGCILDIVAPLFLSAQELPWSVSFARASDLKEGTLKFRLTDVRPSIFLGVPRVWEKIQEGMLAARAANPPGCCLNSMISNAKANGRAYAQNKILGGTGKSRGCYKAPCNQAIYKKAKDRLGLDRCFFALSGAAPIQQCTVDYFAELGIYINDVYGMSEGTAVITMSTPEIHLPGSCGAALEGAEVSILIEGLDQAGTKTYTSAPPCPPVMFDSGAIPEQFQGEVCYRSRSVMMGYLANPAWGPEHVENLKKKNAEAIDADGWLHSGDKGTMCTRGMFKITGRYKELIIGAGGENIAPVPIEAAIKNSLGGQGGVVSNVVMVGDKQKFNVCLITLTTVDPESLQLAGKASEVSGAKTVADAINDPAFVDKITAAITMVNKDGSVCPSAASRVGKFTILPKDLSVDAEEFTPTLKLRRKVVESNYSAVLEAMYSPEHAKHTYVPFAPNKG